MPTLVLVTCRHVAAARGRELEDCLDLALRALPPASAVVQLREKDLPPRKLYTLTQAMLRITRRYRCPLLINDRLDVAMAAGADGVHLPESGLPIASAHRLARPSGQAFLIGRSVHSADGAGAAARDGADLVLCGPIWPTPSKQALGEPLGTRELVRAARSVAEANQRCRLFAIGGVRTRDQIREAIAAGAHGVAAIRAWIEADDPGLAASELYAAIADSKP